MNINGKKYQTVKLLGKGKGGYSYLVADLEKLYVIKQIHHEPCKYYTFGNKLEAELNDYKRLKEVGVPMPEMLEVDVGNERILKEYIEGDSVFDLLLKDKMKQEYVNRITKLAEKLKSFNLNIDYFPTNFIVKKGKIYYVDYECNIYDEKWSFENWGIKYWSKTPEFLDYVKETEKK